LETVTGVVRPWSDACARDCETEHSAEWTGDDGGEGSREIDRDCVNVGGRDLDLDCWDDGRAYQHTGTLHTAQQIWHKTQQIA